MSADEVVVGGGTIHLNADEAEVRTIRIASARAKVIATTGVTIANLDATAVERLDLETEQPTALRVLAVGEGKVVLGGAKTADEVEVRTGVLAIPEGLVARTVRSATDSVLVRDGTLEVDLLDSPTVVLESRAGIRFRKDRVGVTIRLNGGRMSIASAEVTVEDAEIVGTGGAIDVVGGRLVSPVFACDIPPDVTVSAGGDVVDAQGPVRLGLGHEATFTGGEAEGAVLRHLTTTDRPRALERLDFFQLHPGVLSELERVHRVTPLWPAVRADAVAMALVMDCGVRNEASRPRERRVLLVPSRKAAGREGRLRRRSSSRT